MTLRHLKIFVTVYQEGSVTKAAKKLYIAQPSVSFAIKEMEDHYQTPLFERLSRKLYVTPFGETIYTYALRILNLYDEMDAHFESFLTQKTIRIGCGTAIGSFYMPQIVRKFCQEHTDAQIYITVNNASVIETMVDDNSLDFAMMEGTTQPHNLSQELLQFNPIVAICNNEHPLAEREEVTAEDLAREHLLLREKNSPTRQSVDTFFYNHNLTVTPFWESMDAAALINAVNCNLGIAFIPSNHLLAFDKKQISVLNVKDFHANRFVNLLYHKDKVLTPLMTEFIQFCRDSLYFQSGPSL